MCIRDRVYRYHPENKSQSMEYQYPGSPSLKKVKTHSFSIYSCYNFLDTRSIIYTQFLLKGMINNTSTVKCNNHSHHALQNQAWKKYFLLHYHNARSYCNAMSYCSQETMEQVYCSTFSLQPKFGTIQLPPDTSLQIWKRCWKANILYKRNAPIVFTVCMTSFVEIGH